MTPRTQPVDRTEAALLAAMHKICFADPWDDKAMGDLLSMPGAFGILALGPDGGAPGAVRTEAGFPQGFILCRAGGGEAEVLTLLVLPPFRRQGVGACLIDRAMERARMASADALFLEVAANNAAGRALYSSKGFLEVGRRARYYGGITDALVLRCDL